MVKEFNELINSDEVNNASKLSLRSFDVTDRVTYDYAKHTASKVKEAIKIIEARRKEYTTPLDAQKKELMAIEKDATSPLYAFIEEHKTKMVNYSNEQERVEREANEKIRKEAEKMLGDNDDLGSVVDVASSSILSVQVDKGNNIMTLSKARVIGDVDWNIVVGALSKAGKFDENVLMKGLPAAMKIAGIDSITGIEIYQTKTQRI